MTIPSVPSVPRVTETSAHHDTAAPGHSRRRVLAGALAGAAAGLLARPAAAAAAGRLGRARGSGGSLSGVTLRLGDQVSLLETALGSAGQLDDLEYAIEWTSFPSGPPLLEALAGGAIDLGAVGDTPPLFAAAGGAPLRIIYAHRLPQHGQGFVLPAGSDVTGIAELAGRKVAVTRGSSAHWTLLKGLLDNGLTLDDVEPIYLQPVDALAAFSGGEVDAWVIWEPFTTIALANDATLLLSGEDLAIPGYNFQVTSEQALSDPDKVAAIADLLERFQAALEWQRSNKEEWKDAYVELSGLPADLAEALLRYDTEDVVLDDAVIADLQAAADAFSAAGEFDAPIDATTLVDTRFVDS